MENIINETFYFDNNFYDNSISESDVNGSYYGDYTSYNEREYSCIAGEVALWRAVLLQSLIDLKTQSKKRRNKKVKQDAIDWFTKKENKPDVMAVCRYAKYEYRQVSNFVNDFLNNNKNTKTNQNKLFIIS